MSTPKVFFNASVVLAGLHSPSGGSAKLLEWTKHERIKGIISEIVLDEVLRHAEKVGVQATAAQKRIKVIFREITTAPKQTTAEKWMRRVSDVGDAHLFASCEETKAEFLVSLDKKHVLSLSKKVSSVKIVSPGGLISLLPIKKGRV